MAGEKAEFNKAAAAKPLSTTELLQKIVTTKKALQKAADETVEGLNTRFWGSDVRVLELLEAVVENQQKLEERLKKLEPQPLKSPGEGVIVRDNPKP